MKTPKRGESDLSTLLRVATDLHGHFGPFLALGVRMGLFGLRKLNAQQGDTRLTVTVMLEYVVPFSCILDGIQTSTRCTVGNARLAWKQSTKMGAIFQLSSSEQQVEVWISPAVVNELKRKLTKQPSDEEIRQIGFDIASRADPELFLPRS